MLINTHFDIHQLEIRYLSDNVKPIVEPSEESKQHSGCSGETCGVQGAAGASVNISGSGFKSYQADTSGVIKSTGGCLNGLCGSGSTSGNVFQGAGT